MFTLLMSLWPVLTLIATACALLLLGAFTGARYSRLGAALALAALAVTALGQTCQFYTGVSDLGVSNAIIGGITGSYVGLIASCTGILFVLLAWGGRGSLAVGGERNEYFALLLLSLSGLALTGLANSTILLFLGLELASIPTYIMVAISRPVEAAQEAGVKYFFLGALAAALMLFGFSYLYGASGTVLLSGNGMIYLQGTAAPAAALTDFASAHAAGLPALAKLGLVFALAGFAFKMAAFPLHVYAADVYEGAASPLTAMLSVVPKVAGLAAIVKVLVAIGGPAGHFPHDVGILVAIISLLTMSVGNVLALLQFNVKRTMAYSSVAHSGYMLAGVAAMLLAPTASIQVAALTGTLVYVGTYAIMNTGIFAVLQQLPSRKRWGDSAASQDAVERRGTASAETFEELAGQARSHPGLGIAMAICSLSLVGIPFTGGFIGKLMLVGPMLDSGVLNWLVIAMMINAAISAGYYLRLPGAMFFRPAPDEMSTRSPLLSWQATLVASACVAGTLALGLPSAISNGFATALTRAARATLTAHAEPPKQAAIPSTNDSATARADLGR
jgi:NADH-quinone oxidoreductase subunit N